MKIGNRDTFDRVFIIAEIGNNHEGDLDLALRLIELAAVAGADAVKFQKINPVNLVSKNNVKRFTQLKKFQFEENEYIKLSEKCKELNIIFLCTVYDLQSIDFIDPLIPAYKIASCDNNFFRLIKKVTEKQKPVLLSMGLGGWGYLKKLISTVSATCKPDFKNQFALLHCVSGYPTPIKEAGLSGIRLLIKEGYITGYSDHTSGNKCCELAVAAGAKIIEKHFTIDNNYSSFRDHKLSADPEEFKSLVDSIRQIEGVFGKDTFKIQACELENITLMRRSIVAKTDIKTGDVLSVDKINWVRPFLGIDISMDIELLGKKINRNILRGDLITEQDIL